MSKPVDMIGKKFGRLTCISRLPKKFDNRIRFLFLCDCGNKKEAAGQDVRSGHTKSCGCLLIEYRKSVIHGFSKTKDYFLYMGMISRCETPSSSGYKYYGAKGISVCERWRESFVFFIEDMGPRPDGTSIDRIDNNGNYEPGNCRWATDKEQAGNKSNNVVIEHNGEKKILSEWARQYGIHYKTLSKRLFIQKLSFKDAVSKIAPKKLKNPIFFYNGKTMHIKDWANKLGIKENTLRKRILTYGFSFEKAILKPIRKYK